MKENKSAPHYSGVLIILKVCFSWLKRLSVFKVNTRCSASIQRIEMGDLFTSVSV